MHHGCAQILRIRLPALAAAGNDTCRPVMCHHARMVDRKVSRVLLELGADRISPRSHQFAYQPMSLCNGLFRLIDELRLVGPPCVGESPLFFGRNGVDVKLFHSFGPIRQLGFGFLPVAQLADGSLVFRTEAVVQVLSSLPPVVEGKRYSASDYAAATRIATVVFISDSLLHFTGAVRSPNRILFRAKNTAWLPKNARCGHD